MKESAVAAGAAGVWTIDDVRDKLLTTSEELRRNGMRDERHGRVIAVTAALTGVGVTTVATGAAFGMAGKSSIVLAELGPRVPELALNLNIAPKHSLGDLILAAERMDASMIREAVVKHAAGVDLLAYLPETLVTVPIPASTARDLQILLRNTYEWVILDVGPQHGIENEELIRHADVVVVVTRIDPTSLRLTRKYVSTLIANGIAENDVMVVANRFGQAGLVPWQKAEEVLRAKVQAWIPDDPRSVNRALSDGNPLVQAARWSKLTRQLNHLASDLQARLTRKP